MAETGFDGTYSTLSLDLLARAAPVEQRIEFRRYLKMPKPARREVAGFALECAHKALAQMQTTKYADEVSHVRAVSLAVLLIRMVEAGCQMIVEPSGHVYVRQPKRLESIQVH